MYEVYNDDFSSVYFTSLYSVDIANTFADQVHELVICNTTILRLY